MTVDSNLYPQEEVPPGKVTIEVNIKRAKIYFCL